jgi:hypothetical protein
VRPPSPLNDSEDGPIEPSDTGLKVLDVVELFCRGRETLGSLGSKPPTRLNFAEWLRRTWTLADGVLLIHSVVPTRFHKAAALFLGPSPSDPPPPTVKSMRELCFAARVWNPEILAGETLPMVPLLLRDRAAPLAGGALPPECFAILQPAQRLHRLVDP